MTDAICSLALWALVQTTCVQYDLPPEMVYHLVIAESGGDPLAVGDKGKAIGLAQFHRGTFEWLATIYGRPRSWPEDALDQENALHILCAALRDGRGALWHGWRRMPSQYVPPKNSPIWAKASPVQLRVLGVK